MAHTILNDIDGFGTQMSDDNEEVEMKKSDTAGEHAHLIILIAGAIAVFAPIIITLTSHLSIRAMSWFIEFGWSRVVIVFSPYLWLSTFPVTAPRLIFVYQVSRYYEKKSTRSTTVLVGLVTELPMWFILSLTTLSDFRGIAVPTPFMAIFAIIIMWKRSYSEPKTPW